MFILFKIEYSIYQKLFMICRTSSGNLQGWFSNMFTNVSAMTMLSASMWKFVTPLWSSHALQIITVVCCIPYNPRKFARK